MSTRKRWKTRTFPGFVESRHRSKVATYEHVAWLRESRRLGMSRVQQVVVMVDDGSGWATYERVDLS